VLVQSVEDILT